MAQSYFRSLLAMIRKPFYGQVPIFPAGQDMSWIPDGGTNIATQFPLETPNGIITSFTFTTTPKFLVWNGQLLQPPADFTVSGQSGIMPIAPAVGDEVYAIV